MTYYTDLVADYRPARLDPAARQAYEARAAQIACQVAHRQHAVSLYATFCTSRAAGLAQVARIAPELRAVAAQQFAAVVNEARNAGWDGEYVLAWWEKALGEK